MTHRSIDPLTRRAALALAAGAAGVGCAAGLVRPALADAPAGEDPWPSLSSQIFRDRMIADGSAILAIDAPYRAEDAAIVPITLRLLGAAEQQARVREITLVIDQNPSPLAATFTLGPNSGIGRMSTHVRVNDYTNMHAVAALDDGSLVGVKRYVKAAGGCSAPAMKQETDTVAIGTMRFRQFPPGSNDTPSGLREAQLMIRHPNYSGLQMDQITHLYIPARFVKSLRMYQGQDLLFGMDGGISVSENPSFRFDYKPNGAKSFRAEAQDTEDKVFKGEWPATAV